MPSLKGFRANRRGPKSGQRKLADLDALDLVHRFVPDNLKGLLRELPSLPSQNAILLGWASELPVLIRMNDLPKEQQPLSDDPDFWDVWTGKETRDVNWEEVAKDWQQMSKKVPEKFYDKEQAD